MAFQTPTTARGQNVLAIVFLMLLSYFTYVHNFQIPQSFFWDENYHVASAQKYLNGVYFMEPHPPLGKLFIALGEKVLNMNAEDNQFIGTDYARNPPPDFSFAGYRLFPVLFAWFTVAIVFLIFLLITKKTLWSMLMSFLYVFDNALIVHMRSAMLESTMLFFAALTILAFLLLLKYKEGRTEFLWASVLFGVAFAGLMATKIFGLILVLFIPALFLMLWPRWETFARFGWVSLISFAIVYAGVWQIHFSLGETLNPVLPDQGYYQASQQYKNILDQKKMNSPFSFPVMIKDSLHFVSHYEAGVPRLNMCKEDENGSPWFYWPFGAKSIDYIWQTPDGSGYRYLYLQVNPVVWMLGLLGIILSVVLLLGEALLAAKESVKQRPLLLTFLGLYICFMIAVSRIDRVTYLYHYFLPLLLSFVLFALVFMNLERFGKWKLTNERKSSLLLLCATLIFLSFQFFRPLSYYQYMTNEQLDRRSWLKIWDLHCPSCDSKNPLAIPKE